MFLLFQINFGPILTIFSKTVLGFQHLPNRSQTTSNNVPNCLQRWNMDFFKVWSILKIWIWNVDIPLNFRSVSDQVYPNLDVFLQNLLQIASTQLPMVFQTVCMKGVKDLKNLDQKSGYLLNFGGGCSCVSDRFCPNIDGFCKNRFWIVKTVWITPKQLPMIIQTVCVGVKRILERF